MAATATLHMELPTYFAVSVEHELLPTYTEASESAAAGRSTPLPSSPTPVRRESTNHCYQLTDKPGHAWLMLKCSSRARFPEQLPRILEGDKLTGTVELDLTNPTTIKSVKVTVRYVSSLENVGLHLLLDNVQIVGELVAKANVRLVFLELSQELWTDDNPSSPMSFNILTTKGKIRGSFTWPFAFELPRTQTINEGGVRTEYRLPGTFISRHADCTVFYNISATVVHGKFTPDHTYVVLKRAFNLQRTDIDHDSVGTNLAYVPIITPEPPSVARQLAYQEHHPLLGLDGDPEGWHSLPAISIAGMIFGVRSVEVEASVR